MLLAIDTSSFVLGCALAEKDKLVAEWTIARKLTHSARLIPHMDKLMEDAGVAKKEIEAVAVGKGPGSFTGLRIGLATAKMIAHIWQVPLIGVDTLEALAWNMAGANAFILPLIDAQRGNVYAALYSAYENIWPETSIEVAPIEEVISAAVRHGGPIIAVGEGADLYKEKLINAGIQLATPANRYSRAASVAGVAQMRWEEGKIDDPLTLLPNYIRRSEAEVLWEKKHQTQ